MLNIEIDVTHMEQNLMLKLKISQLRSKDIFDMQIANIISRVWSLTTIQKRWLQITSDQSYMVPWLWSAFMHHAYSKRNLPFQEYIPKSCPISSSVVSFLIFSNTSHTSPFSSPFPFLYLIVLAWEPYNDFCYIQFYLLCI